MNDLHLPSVTSKYYRVKGHLSSEGREGLDEDGGLQGHVEAAGDAGALQRLGLAVQLPHLHEAGHLVFGDVDGLASPFSQADVG